jgi:hypothetical protein
VKPAPANARPAVLRVVFIYAFVATLWILFSDTLIGQLTDDAATLVMLGTLKGLAFVVLTSLLLYALLQRLTGVAEPPLVAAGGRRLAASLSAIAILILVVGAAAMHRVAERHEAQAAEQLRAAARTRVGQLEAWLAERRRDAELLRSFPRSAGCCGAGSAIGDAASGESVGEQLTVDAAHRRLSHGGRGRRRRGALLLCRAGEPDECAGAAKLAGDDRAGRLVSGAVELVRFRPRCGEASGRRSFWSRRSPAVAGARDLLLVFEPSAEDFLVQLLQFLPVASTETLLVRRDGETLRYLDPLRSPVDSGFARLALSC